MCSQVRWAGRTIDYCQIRGPGVNCSNAPILQCSNAPASRKTALILMHSCESWHRLMVARAAALRININTDGRPIPTKKRWRTPAFLGMYTCCAHRHKRPSSSSSSSSTKEIATERFIWPAKGGPSEEQHQHLSRLAAQGSTSITLGAQRVMFAAQGSRRSIAPAHAVKHGSGVVVVVVVVAY